MSETVLNETRTVGDREVRVKRSFINGVELASATATVTDPSIDDPVPDLIEALSTLVARERCEWGTVHHYDTAKGVEVQLVAGPG